MSGSERDDEDRDTGERGAVSDAQLEALVASSLRKRPALPITEDAVRRAEEEGVEFEGELPPSLRALVDAPVERHEAPPREAAPRRSADGDHDDAREAARSARVASLDDARRVRARGRGALGGHALSFALGVAAAAVVALAIRPGGEGQGIGREPGGAPSAQASSSAEAVREVVSVPPVLACPSACCAGASCPGAEGELRACATGNRCIPCGDVPPAGSVYRVRVGNLLPTSRLDAVDLSRVDLCARIGGSPWSCEPAYADAAERPRGRELPPLVTVEDIGAGISLELRPRGGKQVLGRYSGSVRVNPTVLCRGVGVLLANDAQEHLGSLSMFVEDAQLVELGVGSVAELRALRAKYDFADVTPELRALSGREGAYALVVGPLDLKAAERLRLSLLELGREAKLGTATSYGERLSALP